MNDHFFDISGRNFTIINRSVHTIRNKTNTTTAPRNTTTNRSVIHHEELKEKKDEEYALDPNIWNQTKQWSALRDQHVERLMKVPQQQQTYFPKMVVNDRKEMITSDALPETVGQEIESPYLRNLSEYSNMFAGVKRFRNGIGLKEEALLNMSEENVEDRIKRNEIPRAPKRFKSVDKHIIRRTNINVSSKFDKRNHIFNSTNNLTTPLQLSNSTMSLQKNSSAAFLEPNNSTMFLQPNNSTNSTNTFKFTNFNNLSLEVSKKYDNISNMTDPTVMPIPKSLLPLVIDQTVPKENMDIMELKQERNMNNSDEQYEIPITLFDDIPTRTVYRRTSPITINFNIEELKPQERSVISYEHDPFDLIVPTSPSKQLYADETSNVFSDDMEGNEEKRTINSFSKLEQNIQHAQSLRDQIARTLLKHCGFTGNRILDAFVALDKRLGKIQKIIKLISKTYGVENTRSIRDLMEEKEYHFVETFLRDIFTKL